MNKLKNIKLAPRKQKTNNSANKKNIKLTIPSTQRILNFSVKEANKIYNSKLRKSKIIVDTRQSRQQFRNSLNKKVQQNRIKKANNKINKISKEIQLLPNFQMNFKGNVASNFKSFKSSKNYKKFKLLSNKFLKNKTIDNANKIIKKSNDTDSTNFQGLPDVNNVKDYIQEISGSNWINSSGADIRMLNEIYKYNDKRKELFNKYGKDVGQRMLDKSKEATNLENKYYSANADDVNEKVEQTKKILGW